MCLQAHVRWGSPWAREAGIHITRIVVEAREPKIRYSGNHSLPGDIGLIIHENVRGFQIEMKHTAAMEESYGDERLNHAGSSTAHGSGSVSRSLRVPPGTYSSTRKKQSSISP